MPVNESGPIGISISESAGVSAPAGQPPFDRHGTAPSISAEDATDQLSQASIPRTLPGQQGIGRRELLIRGVEVGAGLAVGGVLTKLGLDWFNGLNRAVVPPNPTGTPRPTGTASATPGATGTPGATQTENPTGTPEPTKSASPTPEITPKPDAIQQALDAWLAVDSNGEYINDPYPARFSDGQRFEILNFDDAIFGSDLWKAKTYYDFQGELLTSETVVDSDGNSTLVGYFGFEDWGPTHDDVSVLQKKNTRFIIPFSLGKLDYNVPIWLLWKGHPGAMLYGVTQSTRNTTSQVQTFTQEHQGEVLGISVFPFQIDKTYVPDLSDPKYQEYFDEINAQVPVLRDLINLCVELNSNSGQIELKDAIIPPSVASIMNHRVLAGFTANSIPLGTGLAYK